MSFRSITRNFSIQAFGKILSVLIGLVSVGILTRALGVEAFGEYTTAITFLQLFGVIVDLGLTLTLVVMISEAGADEKSLVGNLLSLRMLSALVLFGLAPIIVLGLPWSNTVILGVAVGAIGYFFMSGASLLVGVFQKHQAMWRSSLAELLSRIIMLGLIAWFAYLGFGVVAMIAIMIIVNILWFVAMIWFAKPFVKIRPRFELAVFKNAISRSWPIAISIFFNLLYLKGDILFLAYFREQSEVGLYGLSYKIIDVLTALPTMFMGLVLPGLVVAWSISNRENFRHQLNTTFDIFMIIAIPVIVGAQVVSEPLIRLIAGDGFEESAAVMKLLIIAVVGVFWGTLYGHAVLAVKKQRVMVWGYLATAVVAIAGYLIFIPTYGMWAAAWVTIVSELMIAVLTFIVVYKATKMLPGLATAAKALLASGVMYVILLKLPENWNVIINILIGAVVYFIFMLIVRGIKTQNLANLSQIVNKKS
ncbi:MAG: flippase [Patescibacteria group bacterium]